MKSIETFETGNRRYLSRIFTFLYGKDKELNSQVIKFLESLLEKKSLQKNVTMMKYMRYCDNFGYCNYDKKAKKLFKSGRTISERRVISIFASFHPCGYIRERAVKEMALLPDTLAYILLRRNDHVLQVRQVAIKVLIKKRTTYTLDEFVDAIPSLIRLQKGNRDCFDLEYQWFSSVLLENKSILNKGLVSDIANARLFCASLLLANHPDSNLLKCYLQKEKDIYNRFTIYDYYLKGMPNSDEDIVKMMLSDKNAKIRVMALTYVCDKTSGMNDLMLHYLLDINANVRGIARYYINKYQPFFSFRHFYRTMSDKNDLLMIIGLGENGIKDDVLLIEKYLYHQSVHYVKAAMNALVKLDRKKYLPELILLLKANQKSVVKEVVKIIGNEAQLFEGDIMEIFDSSSDNYVRLKCATLLFKTSKWNALNYMLIVLNDLDTDISNYAKQSIEKWMINFNKSFIVLTENFKKTIINNIKKISRKDISISMLLTYLGK